MPLLTGLTADGTEVPVQVEPDGVLVAEGIQGAPGPAGPKGDTGPQGPPGQDGSGGVSAWARVSESGELKQGKNIADATRTGVGIYELTFTTPMPHVDYATVISTNKYNAYTCFCDNQTTAGCRILTWNGSGSTSQPADTEFGCAIFAT